MIIETHVGTIKSTHATVRSFACRFSEPEFRAFAARIDPDKPHAADPMTRALHAEMVHAIGDKSARAVMRRRA